MLTTSNNLLDRMSVACKISNEKENAKNYQKCSKYKPKLNIPGVLRQRAAVLAGKRCQIQKSKEMTNSKEKQTSNYKKNNKKTIIIKKKTNVKL